MNKKFNRSLIGYNREWVEKRISTLIEEFNRDYQELCTRLASLKDDSDTLREKIGVVKSQVDLWKDREKQVMDSLYQAHTETAMKVYETSRLAVEAENTKLRLIASLEKENAELKAAINGLSRELQNKVIEHRKKLESITVEKRRETIGG